MRGRDKTSRIPVKVIPAEGPLPRKPPWIRVRAPSGPAVARVKRLLREQGLHSVCEEASCPNLAECFSHGTATFMIMGDLCTRRCPFCDVAHGRPKPLDADEPVASGGGDRGPRPALRGDHVGRSGRSARRRRGPFRGLCAGGARREPGYPHRDPGPRFPRPDGCRAGASRAGAAGRVQPQPRDGAAAVSQGPPRLRLRVVARSPGTIQGRAPRRADQVRADGRSRRDVRRDRRGHARSPPPPVRDADHRPVPPAEPPPSRGRAFLGAGGVRFSRRRRRALSGSTTSPAARWCARPITRTVRRRARR